MITTRNEGLSERDFNRIRALVYQEVGIQLGPEKKTMVEVRLKRRLRHLTIPNCTQYCEYLFTSVEGEQELVHLIDAITTNKTDFFREPVHFDYLAAHALPELVTQRGLHHRCRVWSAGCSSGEEPYTLAIVLSEYAQSRAGFRFDILATDICTEVLEHSVNAIYKSETAQAVPPELRRKYFLRSRNRAGQLVRIVPELRATVEFRRVNLMDAEFGLAEPLDIIFCRNVIIYFDRSTQVRILRNLVRHLAPGGYFFAGHSESLQGMDLPLVPVSPSIFRKPI